MQGEITNSKNEIKRILSYHTKVVAIGFYLIPKS